MSAADSPVPLRVGFMPLTDCAPLVIAAALGFDRRHGIELQLTREASWAAIRDKLLVGTLDAAQLLYGLAYGMQLGIGGPRTDMAVLMTLNQNGQGITLSSALAQAGVTDGHALARHIAGAESPLSLAHTFPTGTHALWLYYWLAAHGIHPQSDVRSLTIPPPQMVARMKLGDIDGYSAGEPWHARAVAEGIGFTVATSQSIWPDHPEKVLATRRSLVTECPEVALALTCAVLDAARWLEAEADLGDVARLLSRAEYIGCASEDMADRLAGRYANSPDGPVVHDPHGVRFFGDGEVCYPYLSDGMWFMTQHRRWGLLPDAPDYLAVARAVNQTALYEAAASALAVPLPASQMRSSVLIDGKTWDGSNPGGYAESFELCALDTNLASA